MKKRQDNKANTVLTKSIWKDAKAMQLIQCRNELTYVRNGFSNELMYGQNTDKKRLVLYERLNDVRRKCVGRNGREPGRIESQKRTEGGRGKERGFTQQFLNKYFSSNPERNKERKRRKKGAEDGNARYGRRRGLDPLTPATRNFGN